MMKKTHLTVGIASTIALTSPQTTAECFVAIMGGTIGALICDIDILDNNYKNDNFFKKFISVKITAIILCLDLLLQTGICASIYQRDKQLLILGGLLFGILCFAGARSAHRTFTHSLTGLCLFSLAFYFIYPPIVYSFAIGFLSHILLDLLNKKKIRIFYPKEFGICFGLCYANGLVNTILMYLGTVAVVLLIIKEIVLICFGGF